MEVMSLDSGKSDERYSGLVYDPKTKSWGYSYSNESNTAETNPPNHPITSKEDTSTSTLSNSSTDGGTDKEYREIEYCTLEGDITLIPDENNIKIRVGDTIYLKGVGDFLSGKYYVTTVARKIDNSGYSQSITVIKTGFGDSLKESKEDKKEKTDRAKEVKKANVTKSFKVGDKVKVTSKDASYINSKKIPNWVKSKTLTISKISEAEDKVLLKEIFSWTYTKYISKV